MGGLDLLRRLLLHGARDPELGPLVAVLQVEGDDGLGGQRLRVDVQQLGVHQGLHIPAHGQTHYSILIR